MGRGTVYQRCFARHLRGARPADRPRARLLCPGRRRHGAGGGCRRDDGPDVVAWRRSDRQVPFHRRGGRSSLQRGRWRRRRLSAARADRRRDDAVLRPRGTSVAGVRAREPVHPGRSGGPRRADRSRAPGDPGHLRRGAVCQGAPVSRLHRPAGPFLGARRDDVHGPWHPGVGHRSGRPLRGAVLQRRPAAPTSSACGRRWARHRVSS